MKALELAKNYIADVIKTKMIERMVAIARQVKIYPCLFLIACQYLLDLDISK